MLSLQGVVVVADANSEALIPVTAQREVIQTILVGLVLSKKYGSNRRNLLKCKIKDDPSQL